MIHVLFAYNVQYIPGFLTHPAAWGLLSTTCKGVDVDPSEIWAKATFPIFLTERIQPLIVTTSFSAGRDFPFSGISPSPCVPGALSKDAIVRGRYPAPRVALDSVTAALPTERDRAARRHAEWRESTAGVIGLTKLFVTALVDGHTGSRMVSLRAFGGMV